MNDQLENKIMGKIKDGKLKLKSKYIFWAEKLGLSTAFTLSVILSIIFFNLILFYLKETDNLKYLSFGKIGIFAFLESFPYLLVVLFIILIISSSFLLTKSDVSYKKPLNKIIILMIFFIVFFGAVLTFTSLSQKIEKYSRQHPMEMFFPIDNIRDKGVSGIIFEKYDDFMIVKTPQGLRRINFNKEYNLEKGQFIVSIGERNGFDFNARDIKIIEVGGAPVIEREIDFKFNSNNRVPLYFEEGEKECISNCLEEGEKMKECLKGCR